MLPIVSRPRSSLAVIAAVLLAALTVVLGVVITPAAAETPGEVAAGTENDGVFVSPRRFDVEEDELIAAVEDVRFDGLRLVAVAPLDPQPTAAAFARRVQEETDADAALVFTRDGQLETYVIEDLSSSRVRATAAAREFADPARAVEAFAFEVTTKRESETPAIVGQVMNALVFMALIIGVIVAIEQILAMVKRSRAQRSKSNKDATKQSDSMA